MNKTTLSIFILLSLSVSAFALTQDNQTNSDNSDSTLKKMLVALDSFWTGFQNSKEIPFLDTDFANQEYRRVAYFVQWGIYGRNYRLLHVDQSGAAETLTHINYAFGGISPDLTCTVTAGGVSDSFADYTKAFQAGESISGEADKWDQTLRGNFNQLKQLKAKYPHLKAMISLGGWTWSARFSDVALTEESREKFVSSCVDIYIKGNLPQTDSAGGEGAAAGIFDGIDIDWEYPASPGNTGNVYRPEDTENYNALLQEFRNQLNAVTQETGKQYLMSAALPSAPSKIAKIDAATIGQILDHMNIMAYDFRGAWDVQGPTNFQSNLYSDEKAPGEGEAQAYSVDGAVQAFIKGGAPANKLVVGIPYYGRGWTGVSSSANNGLYQPASNPAQGTYEAGIEDYKVLVNRPGEVYHDEVTRQSWKFDGSNFWSYDDEQVIGEKIAYIKNNNLGGSMVWSLDGDDARATLSKAVYRGFQ